MATDIICYLIIGSIIVQLLIPLCCARTLIKTKLGEGKCIALIIMRSDKAVLEFRDLRIHSTIDMKT